MNQRAQIARAVTAQRTGIETALDRQREEFESFVRKERTEIAARVTRERVAAMEGAQRFTDRATSDAARRATEMVDYVLACLAVLLGAGFVIGLAITWVSRRRRPSLPPAAQGFTRRWRSPESSTHQFQETRRPRGPGQGCLQSGSRWPSDPQRNFMSPRLASPGCPSAA